MECLILGSAAGGGFPQWNCGCPNCVQARSGDPRAAPRTQASIAVSAEGARWLVVGASPDLRQQIIANPGLAPPPGTRQSPVAGVVLVSADVDGIAGLLVLREQHRFRIFAPDAILQILADNSVFASLDATLVERVRIAPGIPIDTGMGVRLTLLEMPGKVPLYQEAERSAAQAATASTYAARIEANGVVCIIAPGCADLTDEVVHKLSEADVLFFDGTLFHDNEMIDAGLGWKTGRRMGHVSVCGPAGSLARLGHLKADKIFFHINNSNPMLIDGSEAKRTVEAAGFRVGFDGMLVVGVTKER